MSDDTNENLADAVAALTAKLASVRARSVAISMGTDTATDASALLDESNGLFTEIAGMPGEMLPVVTELARALRAELVHAPAEVRRMLLAYEDAVAAARFDRVEPPRLIAAFVFLDALERILPFCASEAAKRKW